jgi:hypothetical protein
LCVDSEPVFKFFPARTEIVLNESFKKTESALIEYLCKVTSRYFTKIKINVVSLVLSLVFKTVFGVFLGKSVKLEMPGNFQVRFQGIV